MLKRTVTLTRHKFGEDTGKESIRIWQEAGVAAIWEATWELSLLSLELRGLSRNSIVPMKQCPILRYQVPWFKKPNDEAV